MKKFFITLIFLGLTFSYYSQTIDSTNINSADSSLAFVNDSINVREILAKEIEAIKAKQLEEEKRLQSIVVTQEVKEEAGFSFVEYLFMGLEAVLLVTILIFWLKGNQTKKKVALKKLKFNISKLREEKIICSLTNDLTKVRKQLQTIPIDHKDIGREVIRKARQYEISKGEVFLAAKIQLLSGELK